MITSTNIKKAVASIRSARWRSLLTMLGIIIGVTSVIVVGSLGEGIKRQVTAQLTLLGNDLITVRPGSDGRQFIQEASFLPSLATSTLSEADIATISQLPSIKHVVGTATLLGSVEAQGRQYNPGSIVATTEKLPETLNYKVEYGSFFKDEDGAKYYVVIGKKVAEELLAELVPIGRSITIRGQKFVIRGVMEELPASSFADVTDFNKSVFIPLPTAKTMASAVQVGQILAKPANPNDAGGVVTQIQQSLLQAHNGQADFTVLSQAETIGITSDVISLVTKFVSGIAAISLLVGGIGIMNIMLASVTERTHEIGVRKVVGATNRQVLLQFLIEAMVLSLAGGLIGLVAALFIVLVLRILTDLQPFPSLPLIGIALGASLLVGIVFGIMPAIRAARRDPIDALRQL